MTTPAKILIVDDEASIRLTLEEILTRDGHQIVTADSGQAALELTASQSFDLALIDLKLGDMNGTELLTNLRRQSPHTVTIMLTGYASLETAVEALRRGAHDYLIKPCGTVELRESIRRGLLKREQNRRQHDLLRQLEQHLLSKVEDIRTVMAEPSFNLFSEFTAEQPPAPFSTIQESTQEEKRFLQRGGLIVDFFKHVITLDGYLLELSPTEFALLAYLIGEAPRVVPASELVGEVQGYDSEPWEASETVRSHIYHIRKKIKKATGRTNIIQTLRGVGYSIEQ